MNKARNKQIQLVMDQICINSFGSSSMDIYRIETMQHFISLIQWKEIKFTQEFVKKSGR
jgi:hypothetical protein